jgi:hypothetical protein
VWRRRSSVGKELINKRATSFVGRLYVTICQSNTAHEHKSSSRKRRLLHQKSVCVISARGSSGAKSAAMSSFVLGRSVRRHSRMSSKPGRLSRKRASWGSPRSTSCWYESVAFAVWNKNGYLSARGRPSLT